MRQSRVSLLLGLALVAAAFAYLMAYPPALNGADESYVLYESKRLWEGDAPYRDFFDFITPGTFYFYAAAYALVGPTITAARGATALLNAASCGLTYVLARHVASPAVSALAAAAFITGMVPAWNHAGHHWLATFLSLATAAVTLSRRWRDSGRARPALAGALGAALVCSHQGRGTWVVAVARVTLPVLRLDPPGPDRGWRRAVRESAWAALAALAVATPMLGWAVWRSSLREVVYATYTFVMKSYGQTNVGMVKWGQVARCPRRNARPDDRGRGSCARSPRCSPSRRCRSSVRSSRDGLRPHSCARRCSSSPCAPPAPSSTFRTTSTSPPSPRSRWSSSPASRSGPATRSPPSATPG